MRCINRIVLDIKSVKVHFLFFLPKLNSIFSPSARCPDPPTGQPPVAGRRHLQRLPHGNAAHSCIGVMQGSHRTIVSDQNPKLVVGYFSHAVMVSGAISTRRRSRWKHASVISASSSALCVLPEREKPSDPAIWSRFSRGCASLPTGRFSAPTS